MRSRKSLRNNPVADKVPSAAYVLLKGNPVAFSCNHGNFDPDLHLLASRRYGAYGLGYCRGYHQHVACSQAADLFLAARAYDVVEEMRHELEIADRRRLAGRAEEHTSELQSQFHLVCRL